MFIAPIVYSIHVLTINNGIIGPHTSPTWLLPAAILQRLNDHNERDKGLSYTPLSDYGYS